MRPGSSTTTSSSKEDLLVEVVVVMERQMIAEWKRAVAGVDDPLERLVAGLDHAEARCAEQPQFLRLVLDLYTASLSSPALRQRCASLCSHLVDEIEIEVRRALGPLPAYSLVAPRDLAGDHRIGHRRDRALRPRPPAADGRALPRAEGAPALARRDRVCHRRADAAGRPPRGDAQPPLLTASGNGGRSATVAPIGPGSSPSARPQKREKRPS